MFHGKNRIGNTLSAESTITVASTNPKTGIALAGSFHPATANEVEKALAQATIAYANYKQLSGLKKAAFLKAIAEEILNLGDTLVHCVMEESALTEERVLTERTRTVNQLLLFAQFIEDGSWVEASIDTAQPDRKPFPKTDLRKMLIPIGPVVVFTASNFPLAYSTAGGDTVSALAAGNPVIVKAHELHLGTNELVGEAIYRAAEKTGMPEGVFSYLISSDFTVGKALVVHPQTKSVAFTGSFNGGMALYKAVSQREEPIPVFAEMGSVNPVIFLGEGIKSETEKWVKAYRTSITTGAGQFCTKPGLLFGVKSEAFDIFIAELGKQIATTAPTVMLNDRIASNYRHRYKEVVEQQDVTVITTRVAQQNESYPSLALISGKHFLASSAVQEEVFGPFSLVVKCESSEELMQAIAQLKGQLTGTIIGTATDLKNNVALVHLLEEKVGRIIFNGVPTGVEVCHAIHHGGPFPATTDVRFTSVGPSAIQRFARPICYQNCSDAFLPDALKNSNPLNIGRMVNGTFTTSKIE